MPIVLQLVKQLIKNLKDDVGVTDSTVIYNGVILKQSDRQVDEIMKFDGIKLGCIARLSKQKGLTYLLDAISLISDENFVYLSLGMESLEPN